MENTPKKILHVEDLYKRYGEKLVLENLDLSVSEGTLCSVVGPSGCGKSTLFRILVGQEQASHGKVQFENRPITGPDINRGLVYQRYSLYPNRTVADNVAMSRTLRVTPWEARRRRAEFREEADTCASGRARR